MRAPIVATALTTGLASATLVAGCALGGSDAEAPAKALASALTQRDVSSIRFSGATGAQVQPRLESVLSGMSQVPATVGVGDVQTDGDTASATLTWTWRTGSKPWRTTAPLTLEKSGDAWRPVWRPTMVYADLTAGEHLSATILPATRGTITDADGAPIVTPRPVERVGIDKTQLPAGSVTSSARALARLTGVTVPSYVASVEAAGARAFVEAITFRQGEGPTTAELAAIPGARAISGTLPLAPTKTFAAPLLGRVGSPTKEIVEKSRGTVTTSDQVGLSGLQERYDDVLRGRSGSTVAVVSQGGDATTVHETEPVAGQSLSTTLDVPAQTLAEKALDGISSPSALVAIRPSDGSIVAAASGPGSQGQNTATYSREAPGSTFKVVTSLALLRSGLTPDSPVDCPATTSVDGKEFANYSDYPASALGRVPLRTAIANSCNTAVIGQRDRVTHQSLADAAAALGVGVDHTLGFPAYFGQVPDPASETEAAADLIGQGRVQASPMSMAVVAASVVKGARVVPHLVTVPSGSSRAMPSAERSADAEPSKPLTAAEASQLRALMRAVVTDGSGRALAGLPGDPVIAKTGTAEYGEKSPPQTHAWMIAAQGDLAVAVYVEQGASGSGTAGPVVERFLRGYR